MLAFIDNQVTGQVYTLSTVIAEYAEIEHRSVIRLIKRHLEDLEEFGVIGYSIHKPPKGSRGGRPTKAYKLNEQQATLLITWLENTEPVRAFKKALVRAFYELKQQVIAFTKQRALEKPERRQLTDAIQQQGLSPYYYKHYTDLLFKSVTGMNAKQLKDQRGEASTALDLLTAEEMEHYRQYERVAISLIDLQWPYEDVKTVLRKEVDANADNIG
ncbi:Rha family transcriptional regulator [Dolosigranulum savutiense]|uniref:Rha family transcriptional regulator n=1 Tax=Dolosigranulum savutiense TaxID=3110288 RepID=A0AB74U0Z5_9LACT